MVSWQRTRGFAGYTSENPPVDQLFWATAAMKHGTSLFRVDARGNSLAVDLMAGKQYWVIGGPRRNLKSTDCLFDLSSTDAFGQKWDPDNALSDEFELEGIVLEPGTIL